MIGDTSVMHKCGSIPNVHHGETGSNQIIFGEMYVHVHGGGMLILRPGHKSWHRYVIDITITYPDESA